MQSFVKNAVFSGAAGTQRLLRQPLCLLAKYTHTPTPSVQLEGLVGAAFRCTLPKTKAKINIFGRYAYHLLPTSLPSAVMPATLTFILVSLLLLKKESLRRPSLSVLTFGFQ